MNTATGQVDPDEDADKDYYGRFILGGSGSKNDWITENTSSANHYGTDDAAPYYHMYPGRWDGRGNKSYTEPTDPFPSSKVKVTTGNDPCPAGFRVPSQVEWAGIFTGGSWSTTTPYAYFDTPTLFLPAGGYRKHDTGILRNGGSYGLYWSSTVYSNATGIYGYYLFFNSVSVEPTNVDVRALGMSVRCVAD